METISQRRFLPHDVPSWVPDGSVFFITIGCKTRGVNALCHQEIADTILESIKFRHDRRDWFVHLWLLMPDHLHALLSFPPDKRMRTTIAKWKELTAKKTGMRWQRDFFDHRLRGKNGYRDKAEYIRMNPVRQGLVEEPDKWPYTWEGKDW